MIVDPLENLSISATNDAAPSRFNEVIFSLWKGMLLSINISRGIEQCQPDVGGSRSSIIYSNSLKFSLLLLLTIVFTKAIYLKINVRLIDFCSMLFNTNNNKPLPMTEVIIGNNDDLKSAMTWNTINAILSFYLSFVLIRSTLTKSKYVIFPWIPVSK